MPETITPGENCSSQGCDSRIRLHPWTRHEINGAEGTSWYDIRAWRPWFWRPSWIFWRMKLVACPWGGLQHGQPESSAKRRATVWRQITGATLRLKNPDDPWGTCWFVPSKLEHLARRSTLWIDIVGTDILTCRYCNPRIYNPKDIPSYKVFSFVCNFRGNIVINFVNHQSCRSQESEKSSWHMAVRRTEVHHDVYFEPGNYPWGCHVYYKSNNDHSESEPERLSITPLPVPPGTQWFVKSRGFSSIAPGHRRQIRVI